MNKIYKVRVMESGYYEDGFFDLSFNKKENAEKYIDNYKLFHKNNDLEESRKIFHLEEEIIWDDFIEDVQNEKVNCLIHEVYLDANFNIVNQNCDIKKIAKTNMYDNVDIDKFDEEDLYLGISMSEKYRQTARFCIRFKKLFVKDSEVNEILDNNKVKTNQYIEDVHKLMRSSKDEYGKLVSKFPSHDVEFFKINDILPLFEFEIGKVYELCHSKELCEKDFISEKDGFTTIETNHHYTIESISTSNINSLSKSTFLITEQNYDKDTNLVTLHQHGAYYRYAPWMCKKLN